MVPDGVDIVECDASTHYVADGALAERPAAQIEIEAIGGAIRLSGVPEGSIVTVILEPGTALASMHQTAADGSPVEIEADEPGSMRIIVRPPWPLQEAVYDVEIEPR